LAKALPEGGGREKKREVGRGNQSKRVLTANLSKERKREVFLPFREKKVGDEP